MARYGSSVTAATSDQLQRVARDPMVTTEKISTKYTQKEKGRESKHFNIENQLDTKGSMQETKDKKAVKHIRKKRHNDRSKSLHYQ